jgi:hypothetical protein
VALVRDDALSLLAKAKGSELHEELAQQARIRFNAATGAAEVRSWEMSLPPFLADVVEAGLGHVEVLLEHRLPYTPKRVDALLCGVHPTTGRPSYVLVELKQWTNAESVGDDLVHVPQYGDQPQLHPAEQVRRYCLQLVDFTPMLARESDGVYGLAYLHNAGAEGWRLKQYRIDEYGQLYTRNERQDLIDRLRALLAADPATRSGARRAADDLLKAPTTPSKQLLQYAADEVKNREQFVLLDEQQVAYATVMQAVELAKDEITKTVVIVLGGPGSGKSVVALSLLGDLSRAGRRVMHATGSNSFTSTLRKIVGSRGTRAQGLFVYFNSFIAEQKNSLDVVICDEAHRIRETSVNRWTKADKRAQAKRQVQELIDIARTPVFLLDEHQVVRPGEMGTEAEIAAAATAAGCQVRVVRLAGQYRCGGSEFYDQWVLRLLGLVGLPPIRWSELTQGSDDRYQVAALPSPSALESWLTTRNPESNDTARIAAGYCWPWSNPVRVDDTKALVDDVVIGDWKRPWNAKPDKGAVPGAPASHFWASDPRGFGQVGCIYTAQGFEYDWSGVIFGDDFVRRGQAWVARRDRSHDGAVKKAAEHEFPALVRNTYKVLLTRGMKATAMFSTDSETQAFLEDMCR